ncbi:MAG: hypothetical protein ACWGG5_03765 [Stenotrophomonas sp.]
MRTTTDGGTTSGYSPTGRIGIAIRPAAKITIDSTAAKIGLSMKKREKSICGILAMAGRRHAARLPPPMRAKARRPAGGPASG